MLNIPKENIKPFIAIVVGLAIAVGITLFVDIKFIHKSLFTETEVDMTQYSNTPESKVEENKYNLVSEERRILYYTDEIMDMINKKEFDKLYNILDEDYRKNYVGSVEVLERDMARFADGEYILSYNEYAKEDNLFLIEAKFEKINMTREEMINGISYPVDTLCIREIEKGKYTVAFRGFIEKREINKSYTNGLIKINLKNMTLKSDSTEILIGIENLTDDKINLYDDRMDVYLTHRSLHYKYLNTTTLIRELAPKAKVEFKISFKNIYAHASKPESLKFTRVYGSDGKIKPLKINF